MSKLNKAVVLYMGPEEINRYKGSLSLGAACGRCMMFIRDTSRCAILSPPEVSGPHGVCGLFVGGKPIEHESEHPPMKLVPLTVAGYIEGPPVPTHCGNCKQWIPGKVDDQLGMCKIVEGVVHYYGCCNGWEPKEDEIADVKFEDLGV